MLRLDKNKKYLLACSYGPDSMALFSFLHNEGIDFDVAHVNYHLREESDLEEQGLRAYCKQNNVAIHVLDVKEIIERNIEARCREIRYSFFSNLYQTKTYAALLVAHQQDDLIETYLLQKDRKNLVNYYGIKEETMINNMLVIRPLLSFTKHELEQYCIEHKVPFAIDKSNLTRVYKRNRIRIDVVSKLSKEERDICIEEIRGKNNELSLILQKISCLGNSIDELKTLTNVELAYYLYQKTSSINPKYHITHKCVGEVMKLINSNKPNIVLRLGKKIIIEKSYDKLIVKKEEINPYYSFVVSQPCEMDNEFFYLDFRGDTKNRNVSLNDYPLTIRTYQKNDKYIIKDYEVPVRRLFIDWKMPLSLRKRWPIILNKDNRIIYIPRYQNDFTFDKVPNFYVK